MRLHCTPFHQVLSIATLSDFQLMADENSGDIAVFAALLTGQG